MQSAIVRTSGGLGFHAGGVVTVPFITRCASTATIGVFDLTFGAHAGIVHQYLSIAAFGNGFAVSSAVFELVIGTHALAIDFQMVLRTQIAFAGVLLTVPHLFPGAVAAYVAIVPHHCGPLWQQASTTPLIMTLARPSGHWSSGKTQASPSKFTT